ncbi:SEA (Seh1-associated) complex subunit [Exophiala xenobiotica]|nr:SEA (Seh1-associated) complex subunit [Exophiala xenobiotica]KAK5293199.1 SEA (Seh1-associated) complex subunit [Exophiala xenobiotica]KAK5487768.1 SEA (Seh1-associated) complex subunit [Exophiala xenobiotica]
MSDPPLADNASLLPPPAPPLPPSRLGPLQRIIAPWGKHIGSKSHGGPAQGDGERGLRQITGIHTYSSLPSQTATHRTGIPIASLDINQSGSHAILAGKEILKTVHIHEGKVTEDLNLRASINSYASTHTSPQLDGAAKRREYLPARDVRWSTGNWAHIVATAATNGRIALYDLKAPGPRIELAWLHEHTGQINKLDFDPFAGYLLLSASQDKSVRLWDMREPKPEKSRQRFDVRSAVRDVRWSPLEPFDFAVCADGGVVQKWDARSPSGPKLSISGHEKACYSLDWHPDGRHVISGGFDKFVRVWDFQSDNRRQKPVLQFRTPHAIRNIRWRPICRATESSSNQWQSTQVAVSYYHDDPRLHIWDLRRPLLPFRELDRYSTPANDLLWADKDLLWTVGDDGVFTQWDVKHATPLYNQLSPCASAFMPDGEYYTFTEDREIRRGPSQDDAALGFLSIPQDKLSGGEDGAISRSFTDDEGGLETTIGTSFRRNDKGPVSSKSNRSQANSPPSVDDKPNILSLDRTVIDRQDLFTNEQVGAAGYIPGLAAEPKVLEYLASNYATPATEDERKLSPDTILHRLEDAFNQNAAACDMVSMHRMAQSWRILAAVIIPELKDWADGNRARRRADAARRRQNLENFRSGASRPGLSPLAGLPSRKGDHKSRNLMSSLFRVAVTSDRKNSGSEMDSTSNMATPLAKPLPDTPPSSDNRWSQSQSSSDDSIDEIAPLPPSILASHSTAAAAARALIESPERVTRSASSSPETVRPRQSTKEKPTSESMVLSKSPKHATKPSPVNLSETTAGPLQSQTQEQRRAALKDYRIQARPVFSLEDSVNLPAAETRNESGESFPMFSASTDSSHKARSLGQSFDSPRGGTTSFEPDREQFELEEDYEDNTEMGKPKRPTLKNGPSDRSEGWESRDSGVETLLQTKSGQHDVSLEIHAEADKSTWHANHEQHGQTPPSYFATTVSSSPDIFHFEETLSLVKPRIHTSNPIRVTETDSVATKDAQRQNASYSNISMDELDCETYLHQDFRPIDLSRYEPKLPFAWSALPLICQCVSFDLENGIGHGQFAAHLLMHVHPYFFHPSFRNLPSSDMSVAERLADRLMTPRLGHRIIEAILEGHLSFLNQMGIFESAALLRKQSVEMEYPRLYKSSQASKQAAGSLTDGDPRSLSIVCSHCQGPMALGKSACERCQLVRFVCPICLSPRHKGDGHQKPPVDDIRSWDHGGNMWSFCQACGHSGHVLCMTEWFTQPFSEGTCPSQGCGCDCGPGMTRQLRVEQQTKQEEEAKLIRGSSTGRISTKRDPVRATASPAVDKARAALRSSLDGERATQSSDERSFTGRRESSRGRLSGLGSSRKSVRLVTPGEESGQSQY